MRASSVPTPAALGLAILYSCPNFTHKSLPVTLLVPSQLSRVFLKSKSLKIASQMCLLPSSGIVFRDKPKIALAFSAWDFSILRQFCNFKIKIKDGMPPLDHILFSSLICFIQGHNSYFKARDGVHREVAGFKTQ